MVTRYDMEYGVNKFHSREPQVVPVQSTQGEWVSFEDYAALAAQVEALRNGLIDARKWIDEKNHVCDKTKDFCDTLTGVIEATTQQHLAELRVEAGRAGYVVGWDACLNYQKHGTCLWESDYADSIRKSNTNEKT